MPPNPVEERGKRWRPAVPEPERGREDILRVEKYLHGGPPGGIGSHPAPVLVEGQQVNLDAEVARAPELTVPDCAEQALQAVDRLRDAGRFVTRAHFAVDELADRALACLDPQASI